MDSVFSSALRTMKTPIEFTVIGSLQEFPRSCILRSVSNFVENISASTRIGNDILFGSIDA